MAARADARPPAPAPEARSATGGEPALHDERIPGPLMKTSGIAAPASSVGTLNGTEQQLDRSRTGSAAYAPTTHDRHDRFVDVPRP